MVALAALTWSRELGASPTLAAPDASMNTRVPAGAAGRLAVSWFEETI
jgi:hypothetical protein